jgi:hypothetical protein
MKHSRTNKFGARLVALVFPALLVFTFLMIICLTGPLTAAAQSSSRGPAHTAGNQAQEVLKDYTQEYLNDYKKELEDYNKANTDRRAPASWPGFLPGPFGYPIPASPPDYR